MELSRRKEPVRRSSPNNLENQKLFHQDSRECRLVTIQCQEETHLLPYHHILAACLCGVQSAFFSSQTSVTAITDFETAVRDNCGGYSAVE